MSAHITLPGPRDVRALLDRADETPPPSAERAKANGEEVTGGSGVVACPPHPRHGGSRSDRRLVAVSDGLVDEGIDCLRFDYGPWDRGRGERDDAATALEWTKRRYDRVGLFGYSFGGSMALLAAADVEVAAISVLAPVAGAGEDLDPAAAIDRIDAPVQVVYGLRDDTADWRPIADTARERGDAVVEIEGDHFFVGRAGAVADAVVPFLVDALG